MASTYPGALDTFTDPEPTDGQDSPSHAGLHGAIHDAMRAVQETLGTNPQGDEDTVGERLDAQEPGALGGIIKLIATTSQSSTTDSAPLRITLGGTDINLGGSDLSTTSGYIQALVTGVYEVTGYVGVTSANRGGDRNVLVQTTTGTPTPASDTLLVRVEITSNNSTTKDTGSWSTGPWLVNLAAGDRVYLSFVQHARTGSTPNTIAFGEDSDSPRSFLQVRRIR